MSDDSPIPPEWDDKDYLERLNEKITAFREDMSNITGPVLSEFVNERIGKLSCALCKGDKFSLPMLNLYGKSTKKSQYTLHANYSPFLLGDDSDYSPHSHEYSLVCQNCGYTMKINSGVVLDWYNDKKKVKQ